MPTLILLTLSNLFMTTAWYWHLRGGPEVANARPLGLVILASWLLAGIEYTLAVPANRIDDDSLARAAPDYRPLPVTGPRVVGAALPADPGERSDIAIASMRGLFVPACPCARPAVSSCLPA